MLTTILLAVLAAVTAGVLLELAARLWLRRGRYYVHQPGLRLEMSLDPAVHPGLEPLVRVNANRLGQRGSEPPADPDTFRILVVGGSAAECYFLDQPTSWPGQLESRLARPEPLGRLGRPAVHVANIGRSSVGSVALDAILARTLPEYPRADVILVMVGASDVITWLSAGAGDVATAADPDSLFTRHPERRYRLHPKQLAVTEVLRQVKERRASTPMRRSGVGKWMVRARGMRRNATTIISSPPDSREMIATFERFMASALRRAAAHADRVIVVRQPWFEKDDFTEEELALFWNGGIGNAVSGQITTYFTDAILYALMHEIDAACERVTRAAGIEQVDLMGVVPADATMYYDQFHHTPRGAALIAEHLAGVLLAPGAGPAGP